MYSNKWRLLIFIYIFLYRFDAGNKEIIDLTNTNNTTSNTNRQNWSKSNESEHPLQQVANSNKMTSNNYSPTSSKQMAPVI